MSLDKCSDRLLGSPLCALGVEACHTLSLRDKGSVLSSLSDGPSRRFLVVTCNAHPEYNELLPFQKPRIMFR